MCVEVCTTFYSAHYQKPQDVSAADHLVPHDITEVPPEPPCKHTHTHMRFHFLTRYFFPALIKCQIKCIGHVLCTCCWQAGEQTQKRTLQTFSVTVEVSHIMLVFQKNELASYTTQEKVSFKRGERPPREDFFVWGVWWWLRWCLTRRCLVLFLQRQSQKERKEQQPSNKQQMTAHRAADQQMSIYRWSFWNRRRCFAEIIRAFAKYLSVTVNRISRKNRKANRSDRRKQWLSHLNIHKQGKTASLSEPDVRFDWGHGGSMAH